MLIPSGNDPILKALAEDALQGVEKRVYGCDSMDHANLVELLRSPVDAIVALCVNESAVNASPETRVKLAPFYAGAPLYVDDPLSIEWMRHYQRNDAQLCHNPAWAASQHAIDEERKIFEEHYRPPQPAGEQAGKVHVVTSVGEAILLALKGEEMILTPTGSGQTAFADGQPFGHHPLVRWAARYGVNVGELVKVDPAVVVKARKEASALIQRLAHGESVQLSVDERVDRALGITYRAPARRNVRRLELGKFFDPSTHYTAEYYDGRGIEYMAPDGRWTMYHGTALHWEGFGWVAKQLASFFSPGQRMLDVGCAAGAFDLLGC